MPKIGMRPIREKALISATIDTLGRSGSLDVRVADIARKAGVSSALAHHYFGGKDQLFDATMRHLLVLLGTASAAAQRRANGPRERLSAIVETSFSPRQFESATIAAWLIFYVRAMRNAEAGRLLWIYTNRLRSNLVAALRPLTGPDDARFIAEGTAALIDGLWLRAAMRSSLLDADACIVTVESFIDSHLRDQQR